MGFLPKVKEHHAPDIGTHTLPLQPNPKTPTLRPTALAACLALSSNTRALRGDARLASFLGV